MEQIDHGISSIQIDQPTEQVSTAPPPATGQEDAGQIKEPPSLELRILIDNNQVGAIIGKAGANVKAVREATSVYVSILKTDFRTVQERILVLKGQMESVANAVAMVFKSIQEAQKDIVLNGISTARLLVHKSTVGAVIGLGGVTVRDTQAETRTRIQISNEPLANSTDKCISISGTPDQLRVTVLKVLQQLSTNPLKAGAREYPYIPGQSLAAMGLSGVPGSPYTLQGGMGLMMQNQQQQQQQHSQMGMYAGAAQAAYGVGMPAAAVLQATSTQKIAIPTITAGRVIGKSGATIRDIRMQSQTTISIADPEATSEEERVVTISGTPQGIQAAIYLIKQLVEQYEPSS